MRALARAYPGGVQQPAVPASDPPSLGDGSDDPAADDPAASARARTAARRRRRDRRGRGLRGPLAPPNVPLHRTRAETFDDLVLACVERLEPAWGEALADVDVVVLDVPPPQPAARGLPGDATSDPVPLGRAVPRHGTHRARLVLYRRPIELRADDRLPELVAEVVVEQVAALLGRRPEEIDPRYGT